MTILEVIQAKNKQVIDLLTDSFDNNRVNASGTLSKSLKEETRNLRGFTEGVIDAEGYALNVEQGIAPNETPSFSELRDSIAKWVQEKPITDAIGNDGAIYAITASIKQKGTIAYQEVQNTGRGTGVISDIINEQLIGEYQQDVADAVQDQHVLGIEKLGTRNSEDFNVI